MARKKSGIKDLLNNTGARLMAEETIALTQPLGPIFVTGNDTNDPRDELVKLFANMPVPSMMTAFRKTALHAQDSIDRSSLLFGDPAVGKQYLRPMRDRQKPKS